MSLETDGKEGTGDIPTPQGRKENTFMEGGSGSLALILHLSNEVDGRAH